MALSSSSLCLYGAAPVTSFVHAALPPWQSRSWTSLPRRHSRSTTRGRCLVPVAPPSGERTATVTIVSPAMTAQAAEEVGNHASRVAPFVEMENSVKRVVEHLENDFGASYGVLLRWSIFDSRAAKISSLSRSELILRCVAHRSVHAFLSKKATCVAPGSDRVSQRWRGAVHSHHFDRRKIGFQNIA